MLSLLSGLDPSHLVQSTHRTRKCTQQVAGEILLPWSRPLPRREPDTSQAWRQGGVGGTADWWRRGPGWLCVL